MLFRSRPYRPWLYRLPNRPKSKSFTYNPATEQVIVVPAGPYDPYSLADIDSTAGNSIIASLAWSPSGNAVTIDAALIPYMTLPATGRQSIEYREFVVATGTFLPVLQSTDGYTATYWINNQAPVEISPIPAMQAYTNIPFTGPILDNYASDAEGDRLMWSGWSVAGLSVQGVLVDVGLPSERTVQQVIGTALTPGTYTVNLTAVDIAGASVNMTPVTVIVGTGVLIPSVVGQVTATGIIALSAAGFSISNGEPEAVISPATLGTIVSTSPAGGTYVPAGLPIGVTVSGVQIPDLFGMTQTAATAALTALQLTVSVSTQVSSYPTGTVIAADINSGGLVSASGRVVQIGTTVYLVVAEVSADIEFGPSSIRLRQEGALVRAAN